MKAQLFRPKDNLDRTRAKQTLLRAKQVAIL
jgi:hypothetical protein